MYLSKVKLFIINIVFKQDISFIPNGTSLLAIFRWYKIVYTPANYSNSNTMVYNGSNIPTRRSVVFNVLLNAVPENVQA